MNNNSIPNHRRSFHETTPFQLSTSFFIFNYISLLYNFLFLLFNVFLSIYPYNLMESTVCTGRPSIVDNKSIYGRHMEVVVTISLHGYYGHEHDT